MKYAVTFPIKYDREEHPVDPRITSRSFAVFEGTEEECRAEAIAAFGTAWAFLYPYEYGDHAAGNGIMVPDFQRQIEEYGLVELEVPDGDR